MPKFMPISTCVSRGGSTLTVRGSWCHLPQHLREGSRDSLRSLHGSFLVARRFGKLQSSNCTGLKSNLPRLGRRFRLGLEPERYLEDLDMFRCLVCGSIGQTPQACGVRISTLVRLGLAFFRKEDAVIDNLEILFRTVMW